MKSGDKDKCDKLINALKEQLKKVKKKMTKPEKLTEDEKKYCDMSKEDI